MKTRAALLLLALVAAAIALTAACGPSDFAAEQQVASVRILASRAENDAVYAHPGQTVTLDTLAVDGRLTKPAPMRIYWLPFVCENPLNDEYYECFAAGADGGTTGGFGAGDVIGVIDAGGDDTGTTVGFVSDAGTTDAGSSDAAAVDAGSSDAGLSEAGAAGEDAGTQAPSSSPSSPTLTFTVPSDIITSHPIVQGAPAPYGLLIAFNVACAGEIKITSLDPGGGAQQVPIACVDSDGNALGPDDYVIGFTRVYVYDSVTNHNPEIDGIVFNGAETKTGVDGTAIPNPVNVQFPACGDSCSSITLTVDVPQSSWEVDPLNKDSSGNPLHESLWVDYYNLQGGIDSEARLLYDSTAGQITGNGSTVNYTPPSSGDDTIWAVVHDSRDGVTWLQVNVTTK